MIRAAICFLLGIVAALYGPAATLSSAVIMGVALVIPLVYTLAFFAFDYSPWRAEVGVLGLSGLCILGYCYALLYADTRNPLHLSRRAEPIRYYVAQITTPAEERAASYRYEAAVEQVSDGLVWKTCTGKILLYAAKRDTLAPWAYGDRLLIAGAPRPTSQPANPQAFDFSRFLGFKNIYHQQFIQPQQAKRMAQGSGYRALVHVYALRSWAAERIKRHIANPQAKAIVLALTLGVTEGLDEELMRAYSVSGVIHVLSVSGLHVGILYAMVLWLLWPLRALAGGQRLAVLLSLVVLWGYAFVTGLSPSVLRATTMFSFFNIGILIGRRVTVYHALAGSAFILLLFNPYLVASVGFQLSYLAVIGIVWLYQPLYNLWEPRWRVVDWLWQISCVSVAAQLATFTLGLFYFHQFPVYFLLANPAVIFCSGLMLGGGLALVAISDWLAVGSLLGAAVEKLTIVVNRFVFWVESLPGSVIDGVYITLWQGVALTAFVGFAALLLQEKRYRYALTSLATLVGFAAAGWVHFHTEVAPRRLVVYSLPRYTAIEYMEHGFSRFYGDEPLMHDRAMIRFQIEPYRLFHGVSTLRAQTLQSVERIRFIRCAGKLIAITRGPTEALPKPLRVDYLIVERDAFRSLQEVERTFRFGRLILVGAPARWRCKRMGCGFRPTVHCLADQGAYEELL